MASWPPQLVKVRAGKRGSGWAVGRSGVLTARHVVEEHLANPYHPETNAGGERCLAVTGGPAGEDVFDCAVVWQDKAADLALLQIAEAFRGLWWDRVRDAPTDLAATGTDPIYDVSAIGFPNATLDAAAKRAYPDQPTGKLLPVVGRPGRIGFDIDNSTPNDHPLWQGLSGAAIREPVSGRLFAIVTEAVPDRDARRLYASPIPDPDTDQKWAAALRQVEATPLLQDRYAPEAKRFLERYDPAGRPWHVGRVPQLADFGVRRARDDLAPHDQPYFPFVRRPEAGSVEDAIMAALAGVGAPRMILLVGESAVGKSRLAAEVVTNMPVLADYRLIWPRPTERIGDLPEVFRRGRVLLWLDDLPGYLGSDLDAPRVRELLTNPQLVIVAISQRESLRSSTQSDYRTGATDLLADETLIARFDITDTPDWSVSIDAAPRDADLARAALDAAEQAGVGLGEYLAAYRELRRRYSDTGPWAKALIDCVADWSRTGMPIALPEPLARDLWQSHYVVQTRYLSAAQARQWELKTDDDQDSTYQTARDDAFTPALGSSALVARTRHGLLPSDIALMARDSVAIPDAMWAAAAQTAAEDPVQANGVAPQAALAHQFQIAERLWEPLITREPLAAFNLGVLRQEQGDLVGAAAAYRVAAGFGQAESAAEAAFNLGNLLKEWGEDDAAKAAYQQAIDSHHPDWAPTAAYGLGILLQEQGEDDAAKVAYQQAIDSHHPDMAPAAAYDLGILLQEQGEIDGARAAYQQAIHSDHPDVAPTAAVKLGNLLKEQRKTDAAKVAYQQAIDSHHLDMAPTAAVNLGIVLQQQGEIDAAKVAYQQAIDSYHSDLAPRAAANLDNLLRKHGEDDAAKAAYQQAIDPPHPDWVPTAAANLGIMLYEQGKDDAAKATIQQATDAHHLSGRIERVTPLVIWAERTRAATLGRYFSRRSAFRRKYRIPVHVKPFERTETLEHAFTQLVRTGELPPGHRVRPDIVVGPHDWIGRVTGDGSITEPLPIANERYTFDRKSLGALRQAGRLYGIPYVFDSVALIRNDALAGRGDMPTTIDELVEAGQDALRAGGLSEGLPLALQVGKPDEHGDAGDPYHLWPLFASVGGSFFGLRTQVTDNGVQPVEMSGGNDSWREGLIEAFARIAQLGEGPGGSELLRPDISRAQALAEFLRGRAPFLISSSRALQAIKERGMEVTVGAVPRLGTHAAQPLVSVYGLFIYRDAPNLSAVRNLLSSYLSNPRAGLDLNTIQPLVPVQPGAMRQLADQDAWLRPYIDHCETGMIMPSYPEMRKAWQLLGQTEYKVLAGDGDPRDIAAAAADRGRELLAHARGT